MRRPRVIQVFEHQSLVVGHAYAGVTFEPSHWEALARYHDAKDNRYFQLGNRRIKFRQYVGVLQVGDLTIEVLPKADKGSEDEAHRQQWKGVLLEMLRISRHLRLESGGHADQQLRRRSLLDIFVDHFLGQVERLLHQGLTRQYRTTESNRTSLSGSLVFPRHLKHNLVHKERFYVRHQVYDRRHLLHQILKEALLCLEQSYPQPIFRDRLAHLRLDFPEQDRLTVTADTFQRIRYNRKTDAYREAIELARLILLHFNPALQAGRESVLAILFDMNELFEDYIYQRLRGELGPAVSRQRSKRFWEYKLIRPDIVIQLDGETIVLDTKWKVLTNAQPSDADLKQLYAYQHYWGAPRGYLVYPAVNEVEDREGAFHHPKEAFMGGVVFVEVVKGDDLNDVIAKELIGKLKNCGF